MRTKKVPADMITLDGKECDLIMDALEFYVESEAAPVLGKLPYFKLLGRLIPTLKTRALRDARARRLKAEREDSELFRA